MTESVEGSLADLEVGDSVVAIGEDGEDGGIVATTISEGAGGFGQGTGGPPGGFEPPADGEPEGSSPCGR